MGHEKADGLSIVRNRTRFAVASMCAEYAEVSEWGIMHRKLNHWPVVQYAVPRFDGYFTSRAAAQSA